jgi:predicted ATPase
MIKSITFKTDWRCFKAGEHFKIDPGLNLLVGDQGTGKSSVVTLFKWAISNHPELKRVADIEADSIEVWVFDFEKDNPRACKYVKSSLNVTMLFRAHGECVLDILSTMKKGGDKKTFVLDEPDMALSIRSINKVVATFQEIHHQVIAAVHNPLLIGAFPKVLSVEHKRWMSSEEFIQSHTPQI